MKNKIIYVMAIVGVLSFTSCAKEECVCTVNGQTSVTTEDDISGSQSLSEVCEDSNAQSQAAGGSCSMQ